MQAIPVTLSTTPALNSGGHVHGGARPTGVFASTSGTTNSSGVFNTTYTASEWGGEEILTATITASPQVTSSTTVSIGISGLVALPPGTGYSLIGQVASHPDNHYGTAAFNAQLASLGMAYAAQYPSQYLQYNDMSLVKGGRFAIGPSWTNSAHVTHRLGTNMDLDDQLPGSARWSSIEDMMTNLGIPFIHEVSNHHWHLGPRS